MEKKNLLYEGKAKKIFETDDKDLLIQYFKDDATAFDGLKHDIVTDKGTVNNMMTARIFEILNKLGIPTHFVRVIDERQMVVKRLKILPVEVVVRNVVAGSLAKRFGLNEGTPCPFPIVEFYYKSDELHDPFMNEDHIRALEFADDEQVREMKDYALKINTILKEFFDKRGLILVDFKLEFGTHNGKVMLGDEITPDTCRLWDKETQEKMDKDRFRRDMGKVEETYQEVLKRVQT
jgi:phosphoribosylaminoimidazole-succinocarboxamide synthase